MKGSKRIFILLAFILGIMAIPVGANALETVNNEYRFGFSAYECGGNDAASFSSCKTQYYNGELTKMDSTNGLSAGTKIMLVLEYTHGFIDNYLDGASSFNTNIMYDPDFVKVVTYGSGRTAGTAAYAAADVANPIFDAANGTYGITASSGSTPADFWSSSVTNATAVHQVIINYAQKLEGQTFTYDNGAIGFVFFEVLSTAAEGESFQFDLDTSDASASWLSNESGGAIPFASTPITLKMAGNETSSDNSLKTFTATGSNGTTYPIYINNTYTTQFSAGSAVRDYYVIVPNGVTSLTINAETTDTNAQFIPGNTNTLSKTYTLDVKDDNQLLFIVSAQNLAQSTYKIHVHRLNNANTLKTLELKNENIGFGTTFVPGTTSYSANVYFRTTSTNVNAAITDNSEAYIVSGTGAWSLDNYGATPNVKVVRVNAENCKEEYASVVGNSCDYKEYTITVNRGNPSTSTSLSELKVTGMYVNKTALGLMTVTGFTSGTNTREFDLGIVDNMTTQVTFSAKALTDATGYTPTIVASSGATNGTGTKNLAVGQNTFTITVRAEDGHSENYTIRIYRKSANAQLNTLSITSTPSGTLKPAFTDHGYSGPYVYEYPSTVSEVTISATVEDTEHAVITGNTGVYSNLDTDAVITVTAEDGNTKSYTIKFVKIYSKDDKLSDLTVSGVVLSPAFDPETYVYSGSVDGTVETATIGASLHDDKAAFVDGYGPRNVNLEYGDNTFYVRVLSEDAKINGGSYQPYNIVITRERKNIKTLDSVVVKATIDGVEQEFTASYNDGEYFIEELPYDVTNVQVVATVPADSMASYVVYNQENGVAADGNLTLTTGNNVATIRVTAHNESTADYNVRIPRAKNNEVGISKVEVYGQEATCTGTTCTITVTNDKVSLAPSDVVVTTVDNEANVTKQTNTITLSTKNVNTFTFRVTAEDGTTSENYEVLVTKEASSDNTLKEASVLTDEGKNYKCEAFVNYACTIVVPSTTTGYQLSAVKNNDNATVEGTGHFTMGGSSESSQTKTITVTSEKGVQQLYQITIERSKSTNANLSAITIDGVTLENFDGVNKQNYSVTVPGTTDAIELGATVADGKAAIENSSTTLGRKNLVYGNNANIFTIKVVAEAGGEYVKTYTVTVTRSNNVDSSLSMIKVGGADLEQFATDDYAYNYDDSYYQSLGDSSQLLVAYNNPAISIVGIPTDSTYGTVSYTLNGQAVEDNTNITLKTGVNTIKVTGIAHNTSIKTEYTLKIYRKLNTNNSIASITIAGKTPVYDTVNDKYTVTVPNDVSEVSPSNVVVTLPSKQLESDPDAIVTIPTQSLSTTGTNRYVITVTSESASQKPYVIEITREKNSENRLQSLTVTGGSFSPSFNPDVEEYDVTLPASAVDFTVNYNKMVTTESVSNAGHYNLSASTMDVNVVVQAENGTPRTYKLHIIRATSAVSTLSNLTVNSGPKYYPLDKDFTPDTTSYVVEVPGTVSEVNIETTVTDTRAHVREGDDGVKSVTLGDNQFTIRVYGEGNSNDNFTDYYLTVRVLPKDIKTLKSLEVKLSDGTVLPLDKEFDPNKTEYVLADQPNNVSIVNVTAEVTDDSDATIATGSNIGDVTLRTGNNTLEITVKAEDNTTKTYTIRVKREKSSDATLKSLSVSGTTISPAFDPATLEYDVEVASTVTKLTASDVTAVPNDSTASANKEAEVVITETGAVYHITVTAEDGTTKTYTLNVTRRKSDDARLQDVELTGASLSLPITAENDQYTLNIPSTATEFTIKGIPNYTGATVLYDGNESSEAVTYPASTTKVILTVVAEDGVTTKPYTFNVITAAAKDATLASLSIAGYTLTPAFDKTKVEYSIGNVPLGTTSLIVRATASNPDATIAYYVDGTRQDSNTVDLPQTIAQKSITVVVTPATGVANQAITYTIKYNMVTSDVNTLGTLIPSAGRLSPMFSSGTDTYSVTVPYETESISFQMTTEDRSATVSDDNSNFIFTNAEPATYTYSLNVGTRTFTFYVRAANGDIKTYQVAVTRTNRTPSNDDTLSNLSVDDYTLSPAFDSATEAYSIGAVPFSAESLTVRASGNYAGQTLTYYLNGTELAISDPTNAVIDVRGLRGNNLIEVHVQPENQSASPKIYQISFTKTPSSNAYLLSMSDSMNKITDFDKNTTDYTINVDSTVNNLTLRLVTEEEHATIGIKDQTRVHQWSYVASNLVGGNNVITIFVTAENGDTQTYKLTIVKAGASELITSRVFGHIIEDGMIKSARLDETLLDLKNELDNDNNKLQIWNADESQELTDLTIPVATGMIVKLIDLNTGSELDRKVVILRGDTSGDGEIDLFDAVKILRHDLGYESLTGAYLVAGDVDGDGEVDLFDAVKILRHDLGYEFLY